MRGFSLGLMVVGVAVVGMAACSGSEGASDDDDGGKGGSAGTGTGGSGGATGGSGGSAAGSGGATGGSGGATGGSGGSAAGSGGASGKGGAGGGAGSGPMPCDTSDFEWEDPGCPADSLRTFGDPVCSDLYKCIVGVGCAGLACDSCIETVSVGYAMNDLCIQGITAAELRDLCLDEALSYALVYPECTPDA